jgi:NAD(P)-dependent dehydrogenase (short-subunit alcohol dehydrogenase family)
MTKTSETQTRSASGAGVTPQMRAEPKPRFPEQLTALRGSKTLLDYSSTKGAINAFTKSLALQAVERGIRVNAVAAGPVWTPLNPSDAGLTPDQVAQFGKSTPMGRPAQPEELAPAYVFLASDADSSFITGTVLQVAGGEIAN